MPHLHIKEFKEIAFKEVYDGVSFNFAAKNIKHQDETLISVSVDDDYFFLLAKEEESKNLLKTDKLTRSASIHNVHRALLAYADLAKLEVLSSNVVKKQKNIHLKASNALRDISFFTDGFLDNKRISIEVGFGSGRHLLHQAKENRDILFIGIEIHRPSIEQVLKQVTIQNIDNLLVLDYDARLFMELVPSNIVEKIFVHFPVPWDKKPHRRVISRSFIEEARRVLKVGGRLELRTDSENYYAYSYETFIDFHKIALHINKNRDIAISSKYEDRWKRMQKNIYDLTMINEESSDELVIEGSFEFKKVGISSDEILALHGVTKRFEGGFVHFERLYRLEDGYMFRVSLGSFDRPEHLYLIIRAGEASYYPTLPLRSKSNLLAHRYLDEVFHG